MGHDGRAVVAVAHGSAGGCCGPRLQHLLKSQDTSEEPPHPLSVAVAPATMQAQRLLVAWPVACIAGAFGEMTYFDHSRSLNKGLHLQGSSQLPLHHTGRRRCRAPWHRQANGLSPTLGLGTNHRILLTTDRAVSAQHCQAM